MAYRAHYWSTDGRPLLGGVMRGESSAFEYKEDAKLRLFACKDANGPHCSGEVKYTKARPEIVRHCGKHTQAIGCVCPDCGVVIPK